jgi:agmatinase
MATRKPWFDLHRDAENDPDIVILGLPFDGACSRLRGAAAAPARLREISRTSDPITRTGNIVESITLRDFGDVDTVDTRGRPMAQKKFLEAARARLRALPDCRLLICLGGDNSISIPSISSFVDRHGDNIGVIWFDAHPDLFESYDGNPDSHACALRRALDQAGLVPSQAMLLATRSFSREETTYIKREGIDLITAAEWRARGTKRVAGKIAEWMRDRDAVYIAVDIDGFDSSCAPGTGYPMPGGIAGESFFLLLELLFARLPIRGLDLTEIAPPLDHNDTTAFLGVQVVLEAIGAVAHAGIGHLQ